jgi:sortase (surface protein transpeptidase)
LKSLEQTSFAPLEDSSMRRQQRYICIVVLVLLICGIVLGTWARNGFFPLRLHSSQVGTTPTPHVFSTPTLQPTSPSSLDMTTGARLVIPAVGVDAPVEPVGVTSKGALDVPHKNQWTGVGWYQTGPIPGQRGSAVIAGHLDRPGGLPAVFGKLNQLHPGDRVTVTDAQKRAIHFRVLSIVTYRPSDAPLSKIYGDTSGAYLNLITCAGQWIATEHQTSLRLVVYTKMV